MAHKNKDKVYINIDPNKITQQLKDQELITIAPKKKKKGSKVTKKKIFRDTPYPQFSQEFKPKIKAFKGGGRAYGKNS